MICDNCGNAQAKVHMTEIVSGTEKVERHLCQECAEKLGYAVKQHFSISELLAGLAQGADSSKEPVPDVTCPACGLSFARFQTTGRLGCPKDYDVFAGLLAPRLERFHDATQHSGKVPRSGGSDHERGERLRALRAQLRQAVEQEAYERAAAIRDQMRVMEEAGGGGVN